MILELSSWSSLWINNQSTRPSLTFNLIHPRCVHPNLQKVSKQSRVKQKIIKCDNVIIVLIHIHQHAYNFVSNCMLNILMTCTIIQFHFVHKLRLDINQAPNFYSILSRFNFHVLSSGWIFPNKLDHHFIHTQILFYIPKFPTQFITDFS